MKINFVEKAAEKLGKNIHEVSSLEREIIIKTAFSEAINMFPNLEEDLQDAIQSEEWEYADNLVSIP